MAQIKRVLKRRRSTAIVRELFDDCIDCLYEYDLGEELPEHWPRHVRVAIERSRKRIMRRLPARKSFPRVGTPGCDLSQFKCAKCGNIYNMNTHAIDCPHRKMK